MCTCATARRRRRMAKMDKRYKPSTDKARRRAFAAKRAAAMGRSFGYSKK